MLRKIFLFVTILGLLSHCGFTPLHSNKSISNFSINSTSFVGDKTINNYLKINLNQFINNKFEKKFDLSIKTDYIKDILSKDKTAKITNFKLSCISTISISLNGQLIKEIKISESRNMNNIDDEFEEQNKERNIKQNFASSISRKLITEISILNDN